MERLKTMAILALLAALAGSIALATTGETEMRINARQLEDGRVEFALQQRVDGEWSERILPPSRYFPANVGHSRWLNSTPMTVSVASDELEDMGDAPATRTPPITQPATQLPETTCPESVLEITRTAQCTGGGTFAGWGSYVELSEGIWAANALGEARYSSCSLYAENVIGSGLVILNVGAYGSSSGAASQNIITVGRTYRDDLEPGLVEVSAIGCTDWSVVFWRSATN